MDEVNKYNVLLSGIPLCVSEKWKSPTVGINGLRIPTSHTSNLQIENIKKLVNNANDNIKYEKIRNNAEAAIKSCDLQINNLHYEYQQNMLLINNWEQALDKRELELKRSLAPGYLDSTTRLLQPSPHPKDTTK